MKTKLSLADMRLLLSFPVTGDETVAEIQKRYSRRYPTRVKPQVIVNWLHEMTVMQYLLRKLLKAKLVERNKRKPDNGGKSVYHYKITSLGIQERNDH